MQGFDIMQSNAYVPPEEQAARIARWRARGEASGARCATLQRRIEDERRRGEREARMREVAREYRAVVAARHACEELLRSFVPLSLSSCEHNDEVATSLHAAYAALMRQSRQNSPMSVDASARSSWQTAMESVRARVADELQTVAKRAERQRAALEASMAPLHGTAGGFVARAARLRDDARAAVQAMHEAEGSDEALRRAFDEAINAAERDILQPILAQPAPTSGLAEDELARTASTLARAMGRVADGERVAAGEGLTFVRELSARLLLLFPHTSSQVVRGTVHGVLAQRRLAQKRKAALHDYERAVQFVLASYEAALRARTALASDSVRQQAEHARQDARCQLLHAELEKQRAAHAVRVQEVSRRETKARQAADAAAKAVQMRLAQEFQARLQALAEYEKRKAMEQIQMRELARMQEAEAKAALVARRERNAPRVRFHQEQQAAHEAQRRAAEEALRAAQQRKEAALRHFFDLVQIRVGVVADSERVRRATEASKQNGVYGSFAAACQPPLVGYTDEQVMRDPRVRLYHALLEAGLHKTEYGRAVVSQGFHVSPAQRVSDDNPLRTNQ